MRNINNPTYKSLNAKLNNALETNQSNSNSYIKPDFKSVTNSHSNINRQKENENVITI